MLVCTEMFLPQRLNTTWLRISGLCLKYVKLVSVCPPLFTPVHLIASALVSFLPSPLLRSLHPSHFLSTHKLISPLPFSSSFSQHMHSTSHIQDMFTPPFYPRPCRSGGWVWCAAGSESLALIKLRFRKAENGEGQQRPFGVLGVIVKRLQGGKHLYDVLLV